MLMNKIKEELNKWRDIPCQRMKRRDIINMPVLSDIIYSCSIAPIKIPERYFLCANKNHCEFMEKGKRPRITYTPLKEKNKSEGLTLADFKASYKAAIIKIVWC